MGQETRTQVPVTRQPLTRKTPPKRKSKLRSVSAKAWWPKLRRKLKVVFEEAGIVRCEACGSNFALSFAHAEKRRFIVTPQQQQEVALLCQEDHDKVETMHHALMAASVRRIISNRDTPVRFLEPAPETKPK